MFFYYSSLFSEKALTITTSGINQAVNDLWKGKPNIANQPLKDLWYYLFDEIVERP